MYMERDNYYNDPRVKVMDTRLWTCVMNGTDAVHLPENGTFHEAMIAFEQEDILDLLSACWNDNLNVFVVLVPVSIEICPQCGGTGTMVNPSIDCNGISYEDFSADPQFAEDYFSGRFDMKCSECNGLRVVGEPQWQAANPLHEALRDYATDMAELERERRIELRYGY